MSMADVLTAPLPLRLALRELRGGVRGFYVFVACLALGVMAIAGVGSLSRALVDGLSREGRTILGGDVSFALIQREASAEELAFLRSRGDLSVSATLRAMVRTADGRSQLVELKAVDAAYPLYGHLATAPDATPAAMLGRDGDTFAAAADPTLLDRLSLPTGARVSLGATALTLAGALTNEPDRLAGGIGFGPRLLVGLDALRASGLLQPGSLVRWHYRLRLPASAADDTALAQTIAAAAERFGDAGWDVRTRLNAAPQLERSVERFTQYLTLVGLAALMIGGVGVANSARHYLDRKREVIATLKSVGATGTRVVVIYVVQVLIIGAIGTVIGLLIGAALPFALAGVIAPLSPLSPLPFAPALHPGELALAAAYGLFTAAAFALWPLGRAHDVPVSALFRDEVARERRWPRKRYVVATVVAVAALATLAVVAAHDRRIALVFIGAAGAVFVILRLVASAMMFVARHAPRPRSTVLRLAIANIHRPGALTPTVVLSLGLGLAVLVTVLEIDFNLRRQFLAALPQKAPSFFFLDIPAVDIDRFDAFVRERAPEATLERVPMLRGRIVAVGSTKAEDLSARPDARWVLQSDRGITYTDEVPDGSRVVAGEWWGPGYRGPPLLSFEKRVADGLGVKLGDVVTVNVLGRNITARVANLRAVDWQSLGINFVLVFSPGAFAGAPVTHIATVTYPHGGTAAAEGALLQAAAREFPGIAAVRVKDALDAVGDLVTKLVLAIRGASSVTLVAAMLVLGGALAAGHRHRVYDAVILKTLGATRRQLLAAYAIEYLILGLATVLFGVAAGSVAAWRVVVDVMTIRFEWMPVPALAAALLALAATLLFGLLGTFAALGRKPAPVLRNL
jgi:putative ABC transport system permease protein